jgi:hypothetical protein
MTMLQGTFIIDKIYYTVASNGGDQNLTFNFYDYYYAMRDSVGNNATIDLTLTVGGNSATNNLQYGHYFYFDTIVGSSVHIITL